MCIKVSSLQLHYLPSCPQVHVPGHLPLRRPDHRPLRQREGHGGLTPTHAPGRADGPLLPALPLPPPSTRHHVSRVMHLDLLCSQWYAIVEHVHEVLFIFLPQEKSRHCAMDVVANALHPVHLCLHLRPRHHSLQQTRRNGEHLFSHWLSLSSSLFKCSRVH